MEQDRRWFITLAAVLLGFGVLMVHSASITSRPTNFEQIHLSRHLMFVTLGLALAAIAAVTPMRTLRALSPWLFAGTLALLVIVLVPGIGTRVKGAQRWLRLGPVSLQPSELAKLALPLFLGTILHGCRSLLRSWLVGPVLFCIPIALMVPLVLLEPDLGTALFLCFSAAVMLWLSGWPLRNFLGGLLAAVPAVIYLVINKPYQLQRVTGFIATWTDLNQAPYQIQQSLATLGAGGMWGVGLGKGWQKLSFLPEANTDFVFAVIGEELGMLGTLSVVALWAGLLHFGLRLVAPLERGGFARTVATTLLLQIVFQAALNIAVVTALVPPKGISHPLISCGGSNLVVSLISLGVIVSLANAPRRERPAPPVFQNTGGRTLVINRRTITLPPVAPPPVAETPPTTAVPAPKAPRKRTPKAPKQPVATPAVTEQPVASEANTDAAELVPSEPAPDATEPVPSA
ncbi:MAG: FtsW/RodA/SpoVE family cell cycle protein [Planctomycetota bacterium]